MKLYLSNKSNLNLNSNSNVDNLYKNKNYDRTKKKEKKRLILKKKETHVDNCVFGFWVEISTNYFFILYMADKESLFFWKKIKNATYVF